MEYEVEAWEAGGALPRATRAWRPPRRRCARSPRRPGRRSRRAPRWRPWPAARLGPPGPARPPAPGPPPPSRRGPGGRTGVGTTAMVIRMASMRGTTTATTSVRGRSRPWRLPAVRPTTPHSRRRKRPPREGARGVAPAERGGTTVPRHRWRAQCPLPDTSTALRCNLGAASDPPGGRPGRRTPAERGGTTAPLAGAVEKTGPPGAPPITPTPPAASIPAAQATPGRASRQRHHGTAAACLA